MNDCIKDTSNVDSYDIKLDGEFMTHDNGAIRYSKNKGRFDLIPEDVLLRLIETFNAMCMDDFDISISKITEECWSDNYILTIIRFVAYHYFPNDIKDKLSIIDEKELSDTFFSYLHIMLNELAIHFQKGAQIYGERNCQKGLQMWSFKDSGRRHLAQYLTGYEDEPHHISVIWNMWMADWTVNNTTTTTFTILEPEPTVTGSTCITIDNTDDSITTINDNSIKMNE